MPDEIERHIVDALAEHAASLGAKLAPEEGLGGVFARVSARRNRRRAVAGIGSVVAIGAGVVGIVALNGSGGSAPAAGANQGGNGGSLSGDVWACSGMLGSNGYEDYYESCVPVTLPDEFNPTCVAPVPTTAIAPPATLPAPTVDTSPANAVAEACPILAPTATDPPYSVCDTVPPATAPPTTAIEVATSTSVLTEDATTTTVSLSYCSYDVTSGEQHYVVVAGDSLNSIGAMFGMDAVVLVNYNSWPDGLNHVLYPGDVILIPPGACCVAVTDTAPPTVPDSSVPTTTAA